MPSDADRLRATYAALSDDRLLEVATRRVGDLTAEGFQALHDELVRRGLDQATQPAVAAQLRTADDPAHQELVRRFRAEPCPICGKRTEPLNAVVVRRCIGLLIYTEHRAQRVVACPTCLREALRRDDAVSLLFGWWSLPGFFRTFGALRHNGRAARSLGNGAATAELTAYLMAERGTLAARLGIARSDGASPPTA